MKDQINPSHYNKYKYEAIEMTRNMSFCAGNALKYLMRYQFRETPIADLDKAIWYIERIEKLSIEPSVIEKMLSTQNLLVCTFGSYCNAQIDKGKMIGYVINEINTLEVVHKVKHYSTKYVENLSKMTRGFSRNQKIAIKHLMEYEYKGKSINELKSAKSYIEMYILDDRFYIYPVEIIDNESKLISEFGRWCAGLNDKDEMLEFIDEEISIAEQAKKGATIKVIDELIKKLKGIIKND